MSTVLALSASMLCVAVTPLHAQRTSDSAALLKPAPVTREDSLSAQASVYRAIRLSYHATGTLRYRRGLKEKIPVAIADALKIIPGDEWIASVRLTWPAPRSPAASSPASLAACTASRWWCELLHMLSTLKVGNFSRADSMSNAAIAHMPAEVKCIWDDASALVSDKKARTEYERMPCAERLVVTERLWWLTDPLHSVAGNERRMEHLAREVNMRLSYEAYMSTPFLPPWFRGLPGFPWGLRQVRNSTRLFHAHDLSPEEIAVDENHDSTEGPKGFLERAFDVQRTANSPAARFEVLDTRIRLTPISRGPTTVTQARLQLVPIWAAVALPFETEPTDWELEPGYAREIGYSYAGRIAQLEHQHAFFMRDGIPRLVFVSDVSAESDLNGRNTNAFLVTSTSPTATPTIRRMTGGPRFVFSPLIAHDSMIVSFEVVVPGRSAGRVRFGAVPRLQPSDSGAPRPSVSDIALFEPASPIAAATTELDAMLPRLLATTRIRRGATVGLFWEIYGLRAGEEPRISVSAIPEPGAAARLRGAARAVADTLGIRNEIGNSWTDVAAQGRAIEPRNFTLDLSSLKSGIYTLRLSVELPGERPAITTRRITIVD